MNRDRADPSAEPRQGSKPACQEFERGNRTQPHRFHSRYWHLVMLGDRLRDLIDSDDLPSGERLIDFGCGNMPYRSFLEEKFGEYLGADLPGIAAADLVIGPDGRLPIEDQDVDCVLSSQVLQHVEDPSGYLAEAFRVLRPGGSLILSTHGIWQYGPDPLDLWRWTKDGLVLQIERAGFLVERITRVFGLLASALQLLQDRIVRSLPRWCRGFPSVVIQPLIGLVERGRQRQLRPDAGVYVVLARKPAAPVGRLS